MLTMLILNHVLTRGHNGKKQNKINCGITFYKKINYVLADAIEALRNEKSLEEIIMKSEKKIASVAPNK